MCSFQGRTAGASLLSLRLPTHVRANPRRFPLVLQLICADGHPVALSGRHRSRKSQLGCILLSVLLLELILLDAAEMEAEHGRDGWERVRRYSELFSYTLSRPPNALERSPMLFRTCTSCESQDASLPPHVLEKFSFKAASFRSCNGIKLPSSTRPKVYRFSIDVLQISKQKVGGVWLPDLFYCFSKLGLHHKRKTVEIWVDEMLMARGAFIYQTVRTRFRIVRSKFRFYFISQVFIECLESPASMLMQEWEASTFLLVLRRLFRRSKPTRGFLWRGKSADRAVTPSPQQAAHVKDTYALLSLSN